VSTRFADVVVRASQEPGFRGKMVWFPEKIVHEYGLDEVEARALRTGDYTDLNLPDDILQIANQVFDLHDLHAGE
jgi:hypothetical protein